MGLALIASTELVVGTRNLTVRVGFIRFIASE
jgi:hypothetical protein